MLPHLRFAINVGPHEEFLRANPRPEWFDGCGGFDAFRLTQAIKVHRSLPPRDV
jgi:hypothetical protein